MLHVQVRVLRLCIIPVQADINIMLMWTYHGSRTHELRRSSKILQVSHHRPSKWRQKRRQISGKTQKCRSRISDLQQRYSWIATLQRCFLAIRTSILVTPHPQSSHRHFKVSEVRPHEQCTRWACRHGEKKNSQTTLDGRSTCLLGVGAKGSSTF